MTSRFHPNDVAAVATALSAWEDRCEDVLTLLGVCGMGVGVVEIDPAVMDDTVERINITLPRRILKGLDDQARAAGEAATRASRI